MTYRSVFTHIARIEPALTEADDPDSLAGRLTAAAADRFQASGMRLGHQALALWLRHHQPQRWES